MDRELVESKLYGNDLVRISDGALVDRYNECLTELGARTTSLSEFSIDALGWSPEVAEELGDELYLTAGFGNPFALILTPSQAYGSSHLSLFSFDRELMTNYFDCFAREIADITASRAIGLDLDLGFTKLHSAGDLLLIKDVVVRSLVGEMAEAALAQRKLVSEFNADGAGWFNPDLRRRLVESAARDGDLRYRRVDIPTFRYESVYLFHGRVFGGVFVLGNRRDGTRFLVFEDSAAFREQARGRELCFHLGSPHLIDLLLQAGLAVVDYDHYARNKTALELRRELLTAWLLCEDDPELEYFDLTVPQRKGRLRSLRRPPPPLLHELEQLMKAGSDPSRRVAPSTELTACLLRPAPGLTAHDRSVVLRLLCRLNPFDVVQLYAVDRPHFFRLFREWPRSKRRLVMRLCNDPDILSHFVEKSG